MTIATDNSARLGVSGAVNISTGLARWGDSGNILMSTGAADKYGHGGNIQLEVGNTDDGDGGNITAIAGPSSAMFCKSGNTTFRHHIIGLLILSLTYSSCVYLQRLEVQSISKEARGGTDLSTMEVMVDL